MNNGCTCNSLNKETAIVCMCVHRSSYSRGIARRHVLYHCMHVELLFVSLYLRMWPFGTLKKNSM